MSDKDLRNTNLLREGLDDYNIVGKIYGEKEYGNKLEKSIIYLKDLIYLMADVYIFHIQLIRISI